MAAGKNTTTTTTSSSEVDAKVPKLQSQTAATKDQGSPPPAEAKTGG